MWALEAGREGKDTGSLAAAVLFVGGTYATLKAARRFLYLQ